MGLYHEVIGIILRGIFPTEIFLTLDILMEYHSLPYSRSKVFPSVYL